VKELSVSNLPKSQDDFRAELLESLSIIEREIHQLPTFRPSWQSLAVQLAKILCDRSPLLLRVIPAPLFHPMRIAIAPNSFIMHMPCNLQFSGNQIKINCFDFLENPIPLSSWLSQIMLVSDEQDLTIEDIIKYARDKEAAHSDPTLPLKLRALKHAYIIRIEGEEFSSYHISLVIIGAYIIRRIPELL
jgi:hypothetical protein